MRFGVTAFLLAVTALTAGCSSNSPEPSGKVRGVVAPSGEVGPFQVGTSTAAEIRREAGTPDYDGIGRTSANFSDFLRFYRALGYECTGAGPGVNPGGATPAKVWCKKVFFIDPRSGRLAGFWTDSREFRTANGSRPGMRQTVVDRREKAHAYVHALTGIDLHSETADLFVENVGCKPGANLNTSPCRGGRIDALIVEGQRHIGLLEDGIPLDQNTPPIPASS